MKKTIKLTESELRNIIRQAINEEEFDWSAYENPELWRQANRDAKYLKAQMNSNLDIPHANPYYNDDHEKDENNEYSWEQWDNRPIALSPITDYWSSQEDIPGDIDYAIGQNNKRLYGDEDEIELIGNQARDKWVNGASPDYMEGWTDAKLENVIRESVRKTINEGHWNSEIYDKWEQVREAVGDNTMLQELYHYLSSDQIEDFIYDHMSRNYELGIEQ